MGVRLWDNYAGAFTVGDSGGGTYEVGARFTVLAPTNVTALRWYRADTVAGNKPSLLRLWDEAAQQVIGTLTSVPDNGAVGWQEADLPSPVALTAGRAYVVTGVWGPSPAGAAYVPSGASVPQAPAPLSWLTLKRAYNGGAGPAFPTNDDNSFVPGIDVVAEAGPPGPPPATPSDVNDDLAAWLSTTDGTHTDSAPLQDHATLTTVAAQVNATNTKAQGATGFDAIKAVADAVAAAVSGLPGTIAGAVTTITGQLTSMAGSTFSSATNSLVAITDRVLTSYDHALDVLAGNVTFPGSSPHWQWVAGTPVAFDGAVALAVPADAYVLDLTTLPRGLALNDSAGVHVVYRAGWWCPLNDTIGEERHFVDFEHTRLVAPYGRMAGCLVQLGPEGAGTLTPYTLEPV